MTLRQGVEIKLTGDPTKELRFLLGPGGLPRGYPWRGYDGPKRRLKNFIAGGVQMPAEANRVDPAPAVPTSSMAAAASRWAAGPLARRTHHKNPCADRRLLSPDCLPADRRPDGRLYGRR